MSEQLILQDSHLLWILFNQARSAIFKAREKQTGKYRFPNQAAALIIIWARDGQATPTLLARYLFLERHSASELITRMEENGLVTKKRDEKLKSVVRITITPKGKKISTQYNGTEFISEMMSVLSEEERTQMMASLRKLLDRASEKLGVETIWPPTSKF